jgi:hypothetical protein
MLILHIKEKGRYIELPEFKPFRTPAKVDISNLNLTKILMYLKSNNITRYEIISTNDEIIQIENVTVKKSKDSTVDVSAITELLSQDKEQMTNRLDRIESFLKDLLKKKPEIITVKETMDVDKILKDPEIDMVASFIPSINIDGFGGNTTTDTTISSRRDISDSVEMLQKLSKK